MVLWNRAAPLVRSDHGSLQPLGEGNKFDRRGRRRDPASGPDQRPTCPVEKLDRLRYRCRVRRAGHDDDRVGNRYVGRAVLQVDRYLDRARLGTTRAHLGDQ